MQRNSLYLFTVFGVAVRVHVTWLIIFVLVTWSLAAVYFPGEYRGWSPAAYWFVGVVTSLLFFASVLVHELAHSVVARLQGMNVRDIVLFVFGGVSELEGEPGSAQHEFLMALVGPLTSFLIGLASLSVWLLTKAAYQYVPAAAFYLFWINTLLGIFNLIPGFPLDGGRVLRSIIWGVTRDLRLATRLASLIGSFVAYAFIFIGIWQVFAGRFVSGLWIAFIGWFLNSAAQTSYASMVISDLLASHTVAELVNRDYPTVSDDLTVEALVRDYILGQGRRSLPVMQQGRYAGLVTVHSVRAVQREKWQTTRVGDAMIPADKVYGVTPAASLSSAIGKMAREGVHQLVVLDDGRLVGMLARDAVLEFIRTHAELGA